MTVDLVQDVHRGREAFDRHLAQALRGRQLAELGWRRHDDLTLLVDMSAVHPQTAKTDSFLLRLVFDHYPNNPPSAQFVNPETKKYEGTQDASHIPQIEGAQHIHFHPNYNGTGQLICSSTTLEFYKVQHGVDAAHRWDARPHSFLDTIAAIKSGLAQPFYRGRHPASSP